jgi:hypothetical protein
VTFAAVSSGAEASGFVAKPSALHGHELPRCGQLSMIAVFLECCGPTLHNTSLEAARYKIGFRPIRLITVTRIATTVRAMLNSPSTFSFEAVRALSTATSCA